MTKKKRGASLLLILLTSVCLLAGVFCGLPAKSRTASAYDTEKQATVNEIFDGERFNRDNLKSLYGQLMGATDLDTIARSVNYTGRAVSNKQIIVEFNGMKWLAVYLSKADDAHKNEIDTAPTGKGKGVAKKDDVVLTLWLAYAPFDDDHKAKWNPESNSAFEKYPANMYGTSYMRSQVLNNGGDYWKSSTELQGGGQSEDNLYAKFTMSDIEGSVADYLVAPRYIDWQYSQSAMTSANYKRSDGTLVDLNNDAWGTDNPNNFYSDSTKGRVYYRGKDGYTAWKDDLLWLPSVAETGRSSISTISGTDGKDGIWGTSDDQRKNACYYGAWLRSAYWDNGAMASVLYGDNGFASGLSVAYSSYGLVLPALHLNLTAVEASFSVNVTNSVGDHLTFQGDTEANPGKDYTAIITPTTGYWLPDSITVTVGGSAISQGSGYSYDKSTGIIKINGSAITGDIRITADGAPMKITFTFEKNSGTGGSHDVTATYDAPWPKIDPPTREGYTFQGYYDRSGGQGTQIYSATGQGTGNCTKTAPGTLYAHWTPIHYTVTYNANKPSGASGTIEGTTTGSSHTYDTPSALKTGGFTLKGWTFQGWSRTQTGGVDFTGGAQVSTLVSAEGGSIELYAVWKQNSYTIHFDQNTPVKASNAVAGSMGDVSRVYDDGNIALPRNQFTLKGWTFQGWSTVSTGSSPEHTDEKPVQNLTANDGDTVTLYAVWHQNEYGIEFDANKPMGASSNIEGSMTRESFTYDDPAKALSENKFTLTGWTFQGWATSAGSEDVVYTNQYSVRNLTEQSGGTIQLYAVWKANTYTVNYAENRPSNASSEVEGTTDSSPHTYDTASALTTNGYSLRGWTFQGWATAAGDSQSVTYRDGVDVSTLVPTDRGSITLYAVWEANTYTITLNATGGSNSGSIDTAIFDSTLPSVPALPDRYGYNFLGYFSAAEGGEQYYDAAGHAYEGKTLTDLGVTLYAHWSPITYKIVLYDEETWIKEITVTYGELKLPTAESLDLYRENFDFIGWNIYGEQNWKMYSPDKVYPTGLTGEQDGVVVLYAAWEEKPVHALYFDANGGSGAPASTEAHEGEKITLSDKTPERDDYTFAGWATSDKAATAEYQPEGDFTMGKDVVTLYAVWTHNPSLTYDPNGGDFVYPVAVTYPAIGAEVPVTELEPVREGYTFAGWALTHDAEVAAYKKGTSFEMPDADTTLYAVWNQKQFTVEQNAKDGYSISGLDDAYSYGEELSFTVSGASPKVYVNGTRVTPDRAGNYKAKVTEDVYVVVADGSSLVLLYSANGGENAPTDRQFYTSGAGATVSSNTPTRAGYAFQGWAKSKDATSADYTAGGALTFSGEDVTLYAVWKANTYTVTYSADAENVTGSMTESGFTYGTAKALDENAFEREGFVFVGWALTKGGTAVFEDCAEVINLTPAPDGKVTLYAVWEALKTTITFNAEGGGGGSASYVIEYGASLPTSGIMAPVRLGYTFGGYYTNAEGEGTKFFDENMCPVEDAAGPWHGTDLALELHAYWIPTPETIEDNINDVQQQLESSTNSLYSALNDTQTTLSDDLEAAITRLTAAYEAADKLLEGQLKGQIEGNYAALEGKINGLKTTLEAADQAIQDTIDSLERRLNSDINNLRAAIDHDEADIADLQRNVTRLEADYAAADTLLRAEFQAEDTRLAGLIRDLDESLNRKLLEAQSSLDAAIQRVESKLDKAVESLQKAIAENKDTLDQEIKALEAAYEAADNIIYGRIADLQTEDGVLSQRISSLQQAMQEADDHLQEEIDTLSQKLEQTTKNLQKTIDDNEKDIEQKVADLDAAYKNAVSLLESKMIDADNTLTQALNDADKALRAAIEKVQQNLDDAVEALNEAIATNKDDIESTVADLKGAYEAADLFIYHELTALKAQDVLLEQTIASLGSTARAADEQIKETLKQVEDALEKAVEDLQKEIESNGSDVGSRLDDVESAYLAADALISSDIEALKTQDIALAKSIATLESALSATETSLRAAIKEVQDNLDKAVGNLQTAIDNNQTNVEQRLSELETAYKNADTLLKSELTEADGKLDARITALEGAMTSADEALQASVQKVQDNLDRAAEELRAAIEANEKDIEKKVSDLDAAYKTADTFLKSELKQTKEALQQALTEADDALRASVEEVQGNLDKAVEELRAAIENNQTNVEQKLSELETAYGNADTLLKSELTQALEGKIGNLQSAMTTADDALRASVEEVQGNLDKAVGELQAAIEANETDIENKVSGLDTAYKNADALLKSELTQADETLEGKIGDLQGAMTTADDALRAAIKQVQDNLDKAVGELRAAIAGGSTDLEEKVEEMNAAYKAADVLINSDIASLKAQDSALAESIAALDSAYKAADEALWEGIRQVEGKHDSLQQDNEKTERTYTIVNSVLGGVAVIMFVVLIVKVIKRKKS